MILSSTMVNVAVPSIMGTYGVGQSEAQWMATAFLAAMTASQLLGAWVRLWGGQFRIDLHHPGFRSVSAEFHANGVRLGDRAGRPGRHVLFSDRRKARR